MIDLLRFPHSDNAYRYSPRIYLNITNPSQNGNLAVLRVLRRPHLRYALSLLSFVLSENAHSTPPLKPPRSLQIFFFSQCDRRGTPPPWAYEPLPKIVVTICEDEPALADWHTWVPVQDACFGNRLVVPCHPVVNGAFPPLALPKTALPPPPTRRWEYVDGHWRAVLPTAEEQARRGWIARPLKMQARRRRQAR